MVSNRTGNSWRLASDEGAYLMGDDVAPCPLSFVTSGMVASFTNRILALARTRRLQIRDIRLVDDSTALQTLLGLQEFLGRHLEYALVVASPSMKRHQRN